MAGTLERYQKLGLRESLSRIYDYPLACKELSFILRAAYSKVPKNLQAIILQDTLAAFRFLPQVQTQSAHAAAHILLQSAEVALPKQKKVLAITEFKHAVVAHKRCCKARQYVEGSAQLPQDVLIHVFSFLDMQSVVCVSSVCWDWNLAASDNMLWQSQYATFFGSSENYSATKEQISKPAKERWNTISYDKKEGKSLMTNVDWREAFKKAYVGNSSLRSTSNRGYCGHCKSIVWLCNMKCNNMHYDLEVEDQRIKPISYQQIVDYLLEDYLSAMSSDSDDSDPDEGTFSRLWAYPRHIGSNLQTSFRVKIRKNADFSDEAFT